MTDKEMDKVITEAPRSYEEVLSYIESIPKFTSKNTLDVTRAYLRLLGSPEKGQRVIHVAGTNGKGSVSSYLAKILQKAGYTAGLFISPHLVDIRERMSIDGEMVSKDEFFDLFNRILSVCGKEGLPHPAYFEFLYLMAMVWFSEKKPDFLVLETGLGGRLDATNAGEKKDLTVITRIGIDHTQYLGTTLSEIAFEKAGILRSGVPLICLEEPSEAFCVIKKRAKETGAPLYSVASSAWSGSKVDAKGIDFSFCGIYHGKGNDNEDTMGSVRALLPTHGLYQMENASLASAAALVLGISPSVTARGLEETFWPGRMEEIRPGVFLDGGHNADGIRAFLSSAGALSPGQGGKRILLFSVVSDKDYRAMLRRIFEAGIFDVIRAVPMPGARALKREALEETVEELRKEFPAACACVEKGSVEEAFDALLNQKRKEDLLFVSGSLYLVGMLKG
jgi:dihydrofolate synthase/folylpolyglutamate synthase